MSLMCGCDSDYGPSVFRQKMVKAKKEHKCCECRKTINKGDIYEYIFGVWDGDASSFHTCEPCLDLRDSMEAMGFCSIFGELHSAHREYISEYEPPTINQ